MDEEEYDENNILLLNISPSSSKLRKIEVINVEVKPDDTLQALALRYGCTVSEQYSLHVMHVFIVFVFLILLHNFRYLH